MRSISACAILLAAATSASAQFNVHNWCSEDVFIWQSNEGGCDKGPNGLCYFQEGATPWSVPPGAVTSLDWIANNQGTSVKISKSSVDNAGILQFEYTIADGEAMFWDLSDLDGNGAALVGTPFVGDNVMITPVGEGTGVGTCVTLGCPAGQICLDAYQHPDDSDTRWCPATVQTIWLDLCMPQDRMMKRGTSFSA